MDPPPGPVGAVGPQLPQQARHPFVRRGRGRVSAPDARIQRPDEEERSGVKDRVTRGSRMKDEKEFFATGELAWVVDTAADGISERVLSRDPDGTLTRLARWAPGTLSGEEIIRH